MYKIRRFSADKVLGTNSASSIGFTKGRKYDMDLNRLSKIKTAIITELQVSRLIWKI